MSKSRVKLILRTCFAVRNTLVAWDTMNHRPLRLAEVIFY
jgi:hypothetical protein